MKLCSHWVTMNEMKSEDYDSLLMQTFRAGISQTESSQTQKRYSTRSPTRTFGRRHLPSKRARKMFTLYWRCCCRFYEEKQSIVNFGTWTNSKQKLVKPKPLSSKLAKLDFWLSIYSVSQRKGDSVCETPTRGACISRLRLRWFNVECTANVVVTMYHNFLKL